MTILLIILLILESILLCWLIKSKQSLKQAANQWKSHYFAMKSVLDEERNK